MRETPKPTHVSTAEKLVCNPVIQDAQAPVSKTKKAKPRLRLTKCAWMGSHGRDPRMWWPLSHLLRKRRMCPTPAPHLLRQTQIAKELFLSPWLPFCVIKIPR